MKANLQLQPALPRGWRTRRWVEIVLAVATVALLVAGAAYWLAPRPAPAVRAALPDPAAPSVMRYIQAHERLNTPAAVDPAAPAALGYIQAHERLNTPAAVDPAAPSVMRYIQAHGGPAAAPIDPATQSVFDYLRVHTG